MASNPNSNPPDEPAGEEERGPDALEDSGSLLDTVLSSDEDDDMDLDDDESSDGGYSPTEAFDDDEDDGDDDDDDNDEEDEDDNDEEEVEEEEEGNGMDLSRDEGESCKQSGGGDCPICFRSRNPDGPHRICCIPCGHVYGRSCLEKWLQQRQKNSGKCPQCNRKFKQKEIINLYAQLTAVANDDRVGPSEAEGIDEREGVHGTKRGERVQTQGGQRGWRLTKENWDMMCSRVHTLSAKNEELGNRLDAFEGRIIKMLEAFELKFENMLDAMGDRIREKIDEGFSKLFELYKNPSDISENPFDISENPFDISSSNSGAPPPASDGKFEKILDAMEERIGKKIDESFKKVFELYGNPLDVSSPNIRPAPSAS